MGTDIDKTWPHWTDCLGNIIYPDDLVAVSTINGRSPQLVIARVVRINRLNSKGEEIVVQQREKINDKWEWTTTPSCTITAVPVIDARGFFRWSGRNGEEAKAVTYQIPSNIVKVSWPEEVE